MKNKIVVFRKDFKNDVFTTDVRPDIAKAVISGDYLVVEPLIDWSGINFNFPTVKDVEYTIKFKLDIESTANIDDFQVTSSDSDGSYGINTLTPQITSSGIYELKHKMGDNGWVKFYYKHVERPQQSSFQHIFGIDWIEVSVTDPTKDFSIVSNDTYKYILDNLTTNFQAIAEEVICSTLAVDDLTNNTNLDKLKQIQKVYTDINTFYSNPIGLNTELSGLNLTI